MYNIPSIRCLKMDKLEYKNKFNPGCFFLWNLLYTHKNKIYIT